MPTPFIPIRQLVSKARWAMGGLVAACILAGCASTGSVTPPEAISGSAAETELHRLAKTRLQLAAMYFEEGRAEVALGEVAQSLQAYPRYVDAFNLKGWIHMSLQDYKAANESFVQALALRPGDAETLYNLGWLQCQQKQFAVADRNLDAALAAPRSSGQSVSRIWLAKGVCLRQAGQADAALQALEKAHEIEPGNPAIAYNFAEVLHAQGNAERARFYVRRVNNGQWASAQSLWLGIKVERSLGDRVAMRQLADQLHKRFPDSKEWQRFEQGAFDD
ncbi:MAG TPA: tetratricopeptide repeat protein [Comamonas sp.]|uniref:tetratricopeptide repeat protein n=1 Tax=Comamonas halotolerans TaxID=3041496 RepID=UPI0024E0EC9B|nr:tetratricopeptide repeat protein [Comamonas sp. NoAH]